MTVGEGRCTARRRCRACRRRGSCWRTCSGRRRTARWRARSTARTRRRSSSPSGIARPESLQTTWSPSAGEGAPCPSLHSARSSSRVRPGPAGVLDDDDEVVEAPRARRPPPASWSGWAISSNSRPRSCRAREHVVAGGSGPSKAPIGRTPRKRAAAICRSSSSIGLGHRVGRAGCRRRWRRGGRRRRPGGRARASRRSSAGRWRRRRSRASRRSTRPTRPGRSATSKRRAMPDDVAHVELLPPGQVRVPVGAGRVPEVHVGVDDPGRRRVIGHRRDLRGACRRASGDARGRRR